MELTRTNIINALIKRHGYKSYLEIGVQNKKNNFDLIECEKKMCVDPDLQADADYVMTSNDFFDAWYGNSQPKIDCIFIDGLHEHEQVKRDIYMALNCLSDNGRIIVHDCNPTSELMQRVPREAKQWTGDVWKAWVEYRSDKELFMYVVDTDFGVGVICKCGQRPLEPAYDIMDYDSLDLNRKSWLNLITVEEFQKNYA